MIDFSNFCPFFNFAQFSILSNFDNIISRDRLKLSFLFQLLSEFIILSIASGILIWEYRRQSAKDEAKQIELEREKRELRDHVNHITFTVEEQAAQLRELSRITLALKDDLEKASQKNSGFFGLGKSKDEKATTKPEPVNYEANDEQNEIHRPISSAVLKMSLTSV